MRKAFGRFDLVPGEENEGPPKESLSALDWTGECPVYRQAHSKEIPKQKEYLLYR